MPTPSAPTARTGRPEVSPYDALLVVSFGGPEKPEDVIPFLENVTRGRDIPRERLEEVGEHYFRFGGRSPINDLNRAFVAAVEEDLRGAGVSLPVYWGNRNWDPYLADALRAMRKDGVTRALCLITSAYSSYSGCRQYRENLAAAVAEAGPDAPRLDRIRHYFNHPGFVEPMVDSTLAALAELPAALRNDARILYVTHSVPTSMNDGSGRGGPASQTGSHRSGGAYVSQHLSVAAEITERVRQQTGHRFGSELVYCSRSGPPHVPWLEPDVGDRINELAKEGVPAVAVVPIGFVSDHMEVVYDLDTEARAVAEDAGVAFARAATAGLDPRFVAMVRSLVVERAETERARQAGGRVPERAAVGSLEASWDVCPPGCCANPRGPRPALCGSD
ncbi:MAG: Coproporphyrin ferrochelatase [uncultured Nocardioidaceae bacterium]|uniref:Coproporphyrin III ferrochelatase n=1 Tax=uncultured Nocardioidaceae bacterium TaxID=253824 RepID=A0A6J4M3D1_9ACTN|nr:MAG: Coproporphyrin ferrochelatase [uncultured Nocardioidaceae bacterium]